MSDFKDRYNLLEYIYSYKKVYVQMVQEMLYQALFASSLTWHMFLSFDFTYPLSLVAAGGLHVLAMRMPKSYLEQQKQHYKGLSNERVSWTYCLAHGLDILYTPWVRYWSSC